MNRETEIIETKSLRKSLDSELQRVKALPASRETSLAITKLQECIMWLGMNLKRLNDTNPYPNSYDASNLNIEPTADDLTL